MNSIDIIVPCYNEAQGLGHFYDETEKIISAIAGYSFRFILVNDGSRDSTVDVMRNLAATHGNVLYISFSRNFGKESAMYAGLSHSTGDYVIIMDADLQHPPELIPKFIEGVEEGYDCCAARRTDRGDEGRLHGSFSKLFYKMSDKLTDMDLPQNAVDFRIMSRRMVDAVLKMREHDRFSKGIFAWVGFDTKWIPYKNVERRIGTSKWSFRKLFSYALSGIFSFSVKPLRFVTVMGFIISLVALIFLIVTIIKTLISGPDAPGYASLMCVMLLLGGVIEFSVGILGEYLSRVYTEVMDRPIYIIQETNIRADATGQTGTARAKNAPGSGQDSAKRPDGRRI